MEATTTTTAYRTGQSVTAARPLCVVIGALGGQGGSVLASWLVEAAHLAGYPAVSTSIPGVAQRTGATTYYFELFPDTDPPAEPIFSLFPSAGDVDLVVALEPTEAGRALERGLVTNSTTVITSTARAYSTAEKSVAGDGALAADAILQALAGAAQRLIGLEASNPYGRELNAMLFGAIIASGVLPLTEAHARAAIAALALAVQANLAAFRTGLDLAADWQRPENGRDTAGCCYSPPPPGLEADLAALPKPVRPLAGHALTRLVDYQDRAYARRYLDRLRALLPLDRAQENYRLTRQVAQRLGAWMSHEDIIRVAQLKTRTGRLARIRQEVGARPGEPVIVEDYLSPSRDQLVDILPPWLARLVPEGAWLGRHLRWRTFSPLGYGVMKLLAALRPVRPRSAGFIAAQQALEAWLAAVRQAAAVDYELACEAAELAVWVRGYGDVRARGQARLASILADWPARLAGDRAALRAEVSLALQAARRDPDAACGA
ncbi:MAG: indolepyruvate oxidoreductase subunit beta family protein [Anaerolineales bacterium]|nr:indolepyruvate oxidoreductase subunit beta family protein [Anaerolineales bacterium]